jgi:hypothetical protein
MTMKSKRRARSEWGPWVLGMSLAIAACVDDESVTPADSSDTASTSVSASSSVDTQVEDDDVPGTDLNHACMENIYPHPGRYGYRRGPKTILFAGPWPQFCYTIPPAFAVPASGCGGTSITPAWDAEACCQIGQPGFRLVLEFAEAPAVGIFQLGSSQLNAYYEMTSDHEIYDDTPDEEGVRRCMCYAVDNVAPVPETRGRVEIVEDPTRGLVLNFIDNEFLRLETPYAIDGGEAQNGWNDCGPHLPAEQ